MIHTRNIQTKSLKTLSYILNSTTQHPNSPNYTYPFPRNPIKPPFNGGISNKVSIFATFCGGYELGLGKRWMSTARGRSMRSKVERRMQKEAGKTVKQIRQARKLKLKLMTEEERMLYNLRRAKKKAALLLQKLKKYELPELPPSRHDPELLTTEQLQAYKKIGFRNKNYCQVGVRGVFGGVVQNMHMHWKFHETVQVCCDNFPKEKIKEMAIILARLSGGIVVNIHNVKTIIMFRGRNYRQPKNLIPLNTLTKRKALFKARFEQALESQKLNIKKTEQQLRKKGISPDDPVAMASIQRVASTFFNAIDKKEGSPYVYREDHESHLESHQNLPSDPDEDSDQEELDKFIAEIEDAADKEWAEEEAAEKEELGRIRYLNKEDYGGRFPPERYRDDDSDVGGRGGGRNFRETYRRERIEESESESESENESDSDDSEDENRSRDFKRSPRARVERNKPSFKENVLEEEIESENILLHKLDDIIEDSDSEHESTSIPPRKERRGGRKYENSDDSEEDDRSLRIRGGKRVGDESDLEGFSESEIPLIYSDDDSPLTGVDDDYSGIGVAPFYPLENEEDKHSRGNRVSQKKNDEIWDSD